MDPGLGRLTHLGRYQIVRVLGRGAMGVVYEGLDPRLNRPVAIKTILKGHLMDETLAEEYTERFQREAQAVGRLAHPNIVTLHDFGEEGEVAYIVMEFVRGKELAAHFEAGDYFDLPTAVRIMCELLDALSYAHGHGIVHRDIKPANVMIDDKGRVKLTDFGVARVSDGNSDRTQPGTMVGTPSYMSPEQILGLAVGSRTDLFAAGVVLYQFLAHDKPFKGNGPWDVQRKIVNDPAMPPSKVNPQAPKVFDAVVAKALAKKPEQRYPDAASFAADLRAALVRMPAPPTPVDLPLDLTDTTVAQRATKSPRTSGAGGAMRWAVAGGAAMLLAGAGVWWLGGSAPAGPRPPMPSPSAAASVVPQSAIPVASVPARPASPRPAASAIRPEAASAAAAPGSMPPSVTSPSTSRVAPAVLPPARSTSSVAAPASGIPPPTQSAIPVNPIDLRPTVRQNGVASAPRAAAEPASPPRRKADPRCADLLQQAQLGETLSPESLAYLRKECR